MGTETTFSGLIANASSEKIFLVEIRLGEELSGWTITGGQTYTYEIAYLDETITLADSSTEIIRKSVVDLQLDGVSLGAKGSISSVESNVGTYWHDLINSKLYIHPSDDGTPVHHTIMAFFWIFLGTKGVLL